MVLLGLLGGLATALGFAGFAAGFSAPVADLSAASGLAFACLIGVGLPADFDSEFLSDLACLTSPFGSAASGFLTARRVFLARRTVCLSESAAIAAIKAGPVLVGPV